MKNLVTCPLKCTSTKLARLGKQNKKENQDETERFYIQLILSLWGQYYCNFEEIFTVYSITVEKFLFGRCERIQERYVLKAKNLTIFMLFACKQKLTFCFSLTATEQVYVVSEKRKLFG